MSKIKFQGNASGTGVLTITSPNTNSDRTITLPDEDVTLGGGVDGIVSSANATSITIDSAENVGIKTVPKTTHADADVLQVGGTGYLANWENAETVLTENIYINNSGQYKYLTSSHASIYNQTTGKHVFSVAPSGSADATPTLTTALEITNGGRVVSQSNAHAWLTMNGTGTIAISDSYNVSSIADNGTGFYDMNFDVDMANANYAAVGNNGQYAGSINPYAKYTATYAFKSFDDNAAAADDANIMIIAFGDTA